jgi:hypothetical protein
MQFLVGKFTCEMSLDDDGYVVTRWFLSDGRGDVGPERPALLQGSKDDPSGFP